MAYNLHCGVMKNTKWGIYAKETSGSQSRLWRVVYRVPARGIEERLVCFSGRNHDMYVVGVSIEAIRQDIYFS